MTTVKIRKTGIFLLLAILLLSSAAVMLVGCAPYDIKYNEAISIAKKDFGCEKILWIEEAAIGRVVIPFEDKRELRDQKSHTTFYIVGEKEGKEIYVAVPCRPDLENAFLTNWNTDHTFSEVVEKFNECGANYVADVPDDFYGSNADIIHEEHTDWLIKSFASSFDMDCDGEEFYKRLDFKSVFSYQWTENGAVHNCIVTLENGELKAYSRSV